MRKLEGVAYASFDFATQTLHLQVDNLEKVIAQIKLIEPAAVVTPYRQHAADTSESPVAINWLSFELLALLSAVVLLSTQLMLVMLFFKIGELLQDRAVNNSRRSIRGLLAA